MAQLPLSQDMVTQLAFEAEFRGVPICDLIGDLIVRTLHEKRSGPGTIVGGRGRTNRSRMT